MAKQNHKNYWGLLDGTPFQTFFSGKSTKIEHGQMQSLFDYATKHLAEQGEKAVHLGTEGTLADFQVEIDDSYRLYSPIGFLMSDADFDYFKASNYIPVPFPKDEWLMSMVSNYVEFDLTKDQALMLMHLEAIHDNYDFEDMPAQFALAAQHFQLWCPPNEPRVFQAYQQPLELTGASQYV